MPSYFMYYLLLKEEERRERKIRRTKRKKIALYRSNVLSSLTLTLNNEHFIKKYRLSRNLFDELVAQITPFMNKPLRGSGDLPINTKVMIALSFYATGGYQQTFANILSQESVSKCIVDVTLALNNASILRAHIRFPNIIEKRNEIKTKFEKEYQMPGIIGCIGTTHVALVKPTENPQKYLNEHQYYSSNVQIICDFDENIIHVDALCGSATDKTLIFNGQSVDNYLRAMNSRGETMCLLGDSMYPQGENLMTPILNAPHGSPEELYNQMHAMARKKIDRTICLLKSRWQCLQRKSVLHYKPAIVQRIVYACCILHNICNKAGIAPPSNLQETEEFITHDKPPVGGECQKGLEARKCVVIKLWYNKTTENLPHC